ncbi:MAG: signal transduction histidine kinase [Phenylobacterium sp.]|jgi:signal transduction histidine kinase
MSRLFIFQSMMALTVVSGCLVAAWLAKNARDQKGIKALAAFNFTMALWCCGHLLLSLDYPQTGEALLSLNPLMPTLFLHFSLHFVTTHTSGHPLLSWLQHKMPLWYSLTLLVVITSIGFSGNEVKPWLDFPWVLVLHQLGWVNLLYTVAIGLIAHGVLLWGYVHCKGRNGAGYNNARNSIMMMFVAGGWGFTLATSYIFPSLNLNYYPYLLWLLPSYLLLLTFAVVRYQLLAVNSWAIKAIIWSCSLLLLLGLTTLLTSMASQLGLNQLSNIPLSVLWLYSLSTGIALWLLYNPLHQLASRLVYPDVKMTETVVDRWLVQLNNSRSFEELSEIAAALMEQHIRQPVKVAINAKQAEQLKSEHLLIECFLQDGQWQFRLSNWQDVSPGFRHVGDIFSSLLITSCAHLDKSLRLAVQEQARQEELRLVELGGLAAAMAHEIRNPLNIISMASAQCEDKIKQHIQGQLKRADTLIEDLLSYARPVELNIQAINLLPMVNTLAKQNRAQHGVNIEIDCDCLLSVDADAHKLQQVLINCLDNAAAFAATVEGGKVLVECYKVDDDFDQHIVLSFHNNGPPISGELQTDLFKPFISKRAGGSGLGLAIVQRMMKAHGGKVAFSDGLGWNVSFICTFPERNKENL